jgi:RND family efflux transporter MFP subunit
VLIVAGTVFAKKNGKNAGEIITVTRRDLAETVSVAGTVEAKIVSDLGFEVSGIVRNVYAKTDDTVPAGAPLVRLNLGTLPAELESAEAALAIKRAEIGNTITSLDAVREKQDTLVENARRTLLSEGLVAEPSSSTYTQMPPVITGRYTGEEGEYRIRIARGVQSDRNELYAFGIETTGVLVINKTGPTSLGTKGLFVSFPDNINDYKDTTWTIVIPNTESESYTANANMYEDAIRERARALEDAEAKLRGEKTGASIAQAELAQAEAEVSRIRAEIGKRTLTAPFAGTITGVDVDPGESVNGNTPIVSLISNDGFGVEVDLPEIDSVKVRVGNPALVAFDALLDNPPLPATIVSVNRSETIADGIPVYEARLAFTAENDVVRSGMTTTVTITTDSREDVPAIPARAIRYREDGSVYVRTRAAGEERETAIVAGMRSSDGFVEILDGLGEGDTVFITRQ